MASTPDPHPDSPSGPSVDPERVSPGTDAGRESIEDVPGGDNSTAQSIDVAQLRRDDGDTASGPHRVIEDSPGIFSGTAGTGGENKAQDRDL